MTSPLDHVDGDPLAMRLNATMRSAAGDDTTTSRITAGQFLLQKLLWYLELPRTGVNYMSFDIITINANDRNTTTRKSNIVDGK